jgi:hypothetical protein
VFEFVASAAQPPEKTAKAIEAFRKDEQTVRNVTASSVTGP